MKRFWLLLGAALAIAGCGGDSGPSSTVTSVVITGDSTVDLHGTRQLTATALAGNTPITLGFTWVWFSSDSTVLRVSQTGLVTGTTLGTASITATAVPQVTAPVSSSPYAMRSRIARIVFQPFDISLVSLHDTLILNADARDAQNSSVPGIPVTWVSRSPAIVTVADSGIHKAIVAAVANGTTRIVASANGISDSLTATVQQAPANVAITPGSFSTLTAFGRTVQATCVVLDPAGDTIPNHQCDWSVLSAGVVSVNPATGHTTTVTAVGNGTASIQAQAAAGVTGSRSVGVNQVPKTVVISPANFGTPDVTMTTSQSAPFFARVLDSLDHPALEDSVVWTSSDSALASPAATATLDSTVITTFAGVGAATITATAGPASGTRVERKRDADQLRHRRAKHFRHQLPGMHQLPSDRRGHEPHRRIVIRQYRESERVAGAGDEAGAPVHAGFIVPRAQDSGVAGHRRRHRRADAPRMQRQRLPAQRVDQPDPKLDPAGRVAELR